ncbi:MAG TPA: PSD1 and planctomycete cytochrome C domain-containing protein, partial [Blastocatellia bacterium]|nr:PSD1 and planctomycete cytochrome C domain-containing protein [Blastocatellia bacterium]
MTRKVQLLVLLCGSLITALIIASIPRVAAVAQTTVSFNRDIRPILADTCFLCHGPDKNSRKAGLRLDLRDEAIKKTRSGIIPIVPGKPEESEIIRRVFTTDEYTIMPPKDAHKELTAQQKELLKRWVAEGAVYEGHWAYQPVKRPTVPSIRNPQSAIRNPIDAFIQARLAQAGLQPSPEADRRTLIRRVTLDLTGLPPTIEEVNAFVNDKAPDAYEKLVDRLLSSPRYAEKQALHWLDAVRYADTAGFHGDNPYPTWPYRDYVLRAFRNNKPFDEFTREQIAGDLLPNATQEQKIASTYNRLNRVSAEGGVQPKEYLAKYGADRVRTTSNVWLGSTMGCSECHDHKFDPFLAKDFYAMKAFFADIKETGLVPDRGRGAWGSKMWLATPEQKRRLRTLNEQIARAQTDLDAKANAMTAERVAWEQRLLADYNAGKLAWKFPIPLTAKATNGATLTIYNQEEAEYNYGDDRMYLGVVKMPGKGLIIASGANPDNETYTVTMKPGVGEWTALGVQLVRDVDLPGNNVARGADRFVLTEVEAEVTTNGKEQPLHFVLVTPDASAQEPEHPAMAVIDGNPKTGWSTTYGMSRTPFITLRLAHKLQTTANSMLTVRLKHDSEYRRATIGRFRLALSSAEHSWPESDNPGLKALKPTPPMRPIGHNGLPDDVGFALQIAAAKRTKAQQRIVLEHFKWVVPELQDLNVKLAKLQAERDILEAAIPKVIATETTMPDVTRVLPRGNWMDESGEIVPPAVPQFLGKVETSDRRASRLDLANWLVSPNNPLTARVIVNRMWRQFFGTGLSKVLDDLGSQGEWPTHPELLDWLAAEFMNAEFGLRNAESTAASRSWNVKHLIRTIVTSHTYRQSSTPQSAIHNPQSIDPDNRLLAHQNRFRVDAEIVRDIALSVSGLLVEKFGGPSVKPVQPENYLAALNFPKRDYAASRGEDLYRRGLYTHWQRTFLHPSLLTFDAPTREECAVNRVNSNTPLQALVLLNDPIYVEAARVFAQNALKPGRGVAWAFEQSIGRKPKADELRVLTNLHQQSLLQFQRAPKAAQDLIRAGEAPLPKPMKPAQLAAMMTVTRAILNLHETITRN